MWEIWIISGWIAVCVTMVFVVGRATDAWYAWIVRHAPRRVRDALEGVEPESRFVVRVGEAEVVCERPDGKHERVTWSELQRVVIVSTSDGPRFPDTFWLLVGDSGGCAIPWGASGEAELLQRLQRLPGFDNGAVIQAASDVTDARRTCWERGPPSERDVPGDHSGGL